MKRNHYLIVLISILTSLMLISSVNASNIQIVNFTNLGNNYIRVVVKTSKSASIKCACKDNKGDNLGCWSKMYIEPPLEEVKIRVGDNQDKVVDVECWEIESRDN